MEAMRFAVLTALALAAGCADNLQSIGNIPPPPNPDGGVNFAPGIVLDGGLTGCATDTQQAYLKPLDVYFMVDTSGSMAQPTGGSGSPTKWEAVKDAMASFVDDSRSVGIGTALQFFPILAPGTMPQTCNGNAACGAFAPCIQDKACMQTSVIKFCSSNTECGGATCAPIGVCSQNSSLACFADGAGCGTCQLGALSYCSGRDSCVSMDYSSPAVAFDTLPSASSAIKSALAAHEPDGFTPTAAALSGAVDRARTQALAHPDHEVIAVLATDGFPTECVPSDIAGVAQIAAGGVAASPSVRTFVIGVFNSDEQMDATANLNQIAKAGGSSSASIVSTSSDVAQGFLSALDHIRATSLPCEYPIPVPASGIPDYYLVNVTFTTGGVTYLVPKTTDAAGCGPLQMGWYYDVDPSVGTPTKVTLCANSCAGVKADVRGKIDVVQGCDSIVM
jgi:hypothetical protein